MSKEGRQRPKKNMSPGTSETPESQFELRKKYKHDEFCKDNLRDLGKARKFLQMILKPEVLALVDLDRLELSTESFLDEELKKLYADVLYRIPVKGSDENIVVFVLIELKTESDKGTVFQQTKYIVRIWDQELRKAEQEGRLADFMFPMVIPVIFHHGEHQFTAPTELIKQVRVLKGLEPYTLNVKSLLFDVMRLGENDLPDDLELCVLFMVLQAVFSNDVAERLMAIYRKLKPKFPEPKYQQIWRDCLYYAVCSAKNFTREECMGIMTEMQNTGDMTMSMSVADQFVAEGIVIGKAEGKAEGEAKSIIRTLTKRFQTVSPTITEKVHGLTDLAEIERLADFAYDCQTLDEFEAALNK